MLLSSFRNCKITHSAEIGSHLIGQHFFKTETEKMSRIATVRAGHYVAAHSAGAPRTPMAGSATVGETCAYCLVGVEIANTIAVRRSLALQASEFALKELAATTYGTEGIPINQED